MKLICRSWIPKGGDAEEYSVQLNAAGFAIKNIMTLKDGRINVDFDIPGIGTLDNDGVARSIKNISEKFTSSGILFSRNTWIVIQMIDSDWILVNFDHEIIRLLREMNMQVSLENRAS
jgi:hypothetical protein